MTGLTFDAIPHRYTLDGVVVPGVTSILQDMNVIDFSGIPAWRLEAAKYRGTIVHEALHAANDGDLDVDQFREDFPAYTGYLEGWLSFCAQRNFLPILNEHRVASRRHLVAGTIDTLGLLDGVAVLLDFATGHPDAVSKDYQTAAYLGLALEWATQPEADPRLVSFFQQHTVVRRYGIALTKTGGFSVHPYADPADFRKFLTLVEAHRIVAARRGRSTSLAEVA